MKKIVFITAVTVIVLACNNDNNTSHTNKSTLKADSIKQVEEFKQQFLTPLQSQLNKNPDSLALWMQLVDAADSVQLYGLAVSYLDSMIIKDPQNQSLWMRKGRILKNKGDTMNALFSFDKAAQIYPSVEVQMEMSNLFAEIKDKRALKINELIRLRKLGNQYDAYAYFLDGVYYARTNNFSLAIKYLDSAIYLHYSFPDSYIEKGYVYFQQKDFKKALDVFQQLATINITYAMAYYWQAKCYEQMKLFADAITNYQKAYGLDKSLIEAKEAFERLEKLNK